MKTILTALSLAFGGFACAGSAGSERSTGAPATGTVHPDVHPGIVDAEAARKLVAAGVKVVDVRTPAEYAAGHIPGAVNIPYDEVARRVAEIGPPSAPVLLYCRSGRRSEIATRSLQKLGYLEIYDLQEYARWTAADAGSAGR